MDIDNIVKITDEKYLNLYKIAYKNRKNQPKDWIFATRNKEPVLSMNKLEQIPNAVVIVPFHIHENKLVIIREFRIAINAWQYEFPAGLLDGEESIASAAARELMEETGLELTRVFMKSPVIYSSSGITDESLCLVYVECQGNPTTKFLGDSEDIEVLMISKKQAATLLSEHSINFDVKTWIILKEYAGISGC